MDEIEDCVFSGFVLRGRPKNNLLLPEYCKYCFSTREIREKIVLSCTYTTRALTNGTQLSKIEIPIPPKKEQIAISEVLSDIDHLIFELKKLIAKKKDIRQGTMQMLVTGKKRLPGYHADFEHFAIGELGSLAKTSINPCQEPKTIFDEYSMPAFDNGAKPQQMLGELMLSSRIKVTSNTLLFNKLNVRQRRVWLVKDCSNNSVCSSEFLPYKSEKIDLSFFKQLLLTDKVTKDFEDMSSGTSNSQQRITPSDFLKYEISIPSLEEQREIASILLDMDTEIQRHEEKLSKYQKVKQGMMEELLTGKVRLM
ncbi:MAG: restriction endonuclease subunit S [Ruminiclostridium sp.]|nr:restriction endonuclease subunit S [Ruminiclostridium sp.]